MSISTAPELQGNCRHQIFPLSAETGSTNLAFQKEKPLLCGKTGTKRTLGTGDVWACCKGFTRHSPFSLRSKNHVTAVPSFSLSSICSSISAQSLAKSMLNFNKSFFLLSKCQSSTFIIHVGGVACSLTEISSRLLVMLQILFKIIAIVQ